MPRRLRFIPPEGALVEVTCRTVHGRHLLRPGRRLNELVLGILGRAQRKYPLRIHAFVFMSNHYHLLVSVPSARRLARFMGFLNGNLAREAGRLHRWREKFWGRRYQSIIVSEEPAAQIGRLKYVLSHAAKEGFVRHPAQWRGAHCVTALLDDNLTLRGQWVDRTRLYAARTRGEKTTENDCSTEEIVSLEPLPCWRKVEASTRRAYLRELVDEIVREAGRARRSEPPRHSVQAPHFRPERTKRSPAPWFHCASRPVRQQLADAYGLFLAAYREAAEALQRGDPYPAFPKGSFPPAMPYVSAA